MLESHNPYGYEESIERHALQWRHYPQVEGHFNSNTGEGGLNLPRRCPAFVTPEAWQRLLAVRQVNTLLPALYQTRWRPA